MTQMVKSLPAMWETCIQSLGWEDLLEKEMATHSSILVWRIPWTEKPGDYSPWGHRVGHDWATHIHTYTHTHTHTHTHTKAKPKLRHPLIQTQLHWISLLLNYYKLFHLSRMRMLERPGLLREIYLCALRVFIILALVALLSAWKAMSVV